MYLRGRKRGDSIKIGIVGAGKSGTTLGKYLSVAGISVTGFYSKTAESAAWAADFTHMAAYDSLKELIMASDTLFITTSDCEIKSVWDCIAALDIRLSGYNICHFSGSLSSNVFSGIEHIGTYPCAIHSMYAFSKKETSHLQFNKAFLTNVKYHAAAVLAKCKNPQRDYYALERIIDEKYSTDF